MSRYVKSVLWLVGCGGLGYALYLGCLQTSNNEDFGQKYRIQEDHNRKQTVMDILHAASTTNKALYKMSKEEIEKEIIKK